MRVAVTYNLKRTENEEGRNSPSPSREAEAEWDDPETVEAVVGALAEWHDVVPIDAADDPYNALRDARPDMVFGKGTFPRFSNISTYPTLPVIH
jgi:hypothetical protein